MGFKVLVIHVVDDPQNAFVDEIYELKSEFTLLEKLYYCELDYEFAWTPHKATHEAEIIVYG